MNKFPNDADGHALAQVAGMGIDMTKPLRIEYAVSAPDGDSAEAIKQRLSRRGFEVTVDYDEGEPHDETDPEEVSEFGPSWSVYAAIVMVPDYDDIVRTQEELDQISRLHGGYSDGWVVAARPNNA